MEKINLYGDVNNEYKGNNENYANITQELKSFIATKHHRWCGTAASLLTQINSFLSTTNRKWSQTPVEIIQWLQTVRHDLLKTGIFVYSHKLCGKRLITIRT